MLLVLHWHTFISSFQPAFLSYFYLAS
uniref:Uncharacterized protein n=1 Tax=Arundo donax TaxID=35708 RepID=A0A0A8Z490_ARUDO